MFHEVVEQFTRVFGPVRVIAKVDEGGQRPPSPPSVALAGPAAPAAPRLVTGTHCDRSADAVMSLVDMVEPNGPCWRVTITDFGAESFEALAVFQLEKPKKTLAMAGSEVAEEKAAEGPQGLAIIKAELNRDRAEARARKEMRHRIMMMKADRMLTLTARENITDRKVFEKAVAKMMCRCRKKWGAEFQYVLVFERHKSRGGFHCHLALNRHFDVNTLRLFWHKALGWQGDEIARGVDSPGNVDMTSPRKGVWERHKIAKYLSKYMSKGLQGDKNAKSYMSSRGIAKPKKITFFVPPCTNPFFFIRDLVQRVTNAQMCKVWEGHDGLRPMIWYST